MSGIMEDLPSSDKSDSGNLEKWNVAFKQIHLPMMHHSFSFVTFQ